MTGIAQRLSSALADRYRIERELGQGGMATVYLAEDLKHDRKVAIKVLKPELAAVLGAERFVVEIKTTAALSHPHILPLFDSGTADSFLFYVMPYIQGETIREKLNRETQFGVDEAVRIAREVADALDYAHRHGVIHRDIKPENILLHDGRAMVMDFGIALAVSAAAGGRMTETGLSLGTPHYMSPEQATAEKEITGRSDQYSLASVLYEMLAGEPPHTAGSAQAVIMKIIAETVAPVTQLRKSVPLNVAAAVGKALQKVPADRFDNARAFSDALQNSAFTTAASQGQIGAASSQWKMRAAIPLAAATLVLSAALSWQAFEPQLAPTPMRFDLATGAASVMPNSDIAISPDGSIIAFVGSVGSEEAIYLRRLDGDPDFRKVTGTEGASTTPSFSPDNQWIVFRRNTDRTIVKAAVTGGGATILATPDTPLGAFAHWGTDQQIIYSGGPTGLRRIPASGGAPEHLVKSDQAARYSFLLPDGSGVLFSRGSRGVFVLDFKTDSVSLVVPNAVHPVYVETGHLLYIELTGGLFAVPFDLGRHQVTGPAVRVIDQVAAAIALRGFSVSRNGTLVYREGSSSITAGVGTPTLFLIKSLTGATDTLRLPPGRRQNPRFSPNGKSIAFEFFSRGGSTETDIVTFDLSTGTTTPITFESDNDDPVWSPDSKRIAFTRGHEATGEDIYVKPADNSGAEQLLLSLSGNQNPLGWRGADTLLFQSNAAGQSDLFILPLAAGAKPVPYLRAPWSETDLRVSPDGKLAAYVSWETGFPEVWLRDFPEGAGRWRVSTNGGHSSRWSPDGKELYYWRNGGPTDSLFRVGIDRAPTVVVRTPQYLSSLSLKLVSSEDWDLHPDGKRIIIAVNASPVLTSADSARGSTSRYIVVTNWFTELKARTAGSKK